MQLLPTCVYVVLEQLLGFIFLQCTHMGVVRRTTLRKQVLSGAELGEEMRVAVVEAQKVRTNLSAAG